MNVERSMRPEALLDGHIVQGHVDQTALCTGVEEADGSWYFSFHYEPQGDNTTVEKGSVAVNGVSLTVVDSKPDGFRVAIIPYTYEHTNFCRIQKGSVVNIEFDIVGKYRPTDEKLPREVTIPYITLTRQKSSHFAVSATISVSRAEKFKTKSAQQFPTDATFRPVKESKNYDNRHDRETHSVSFNKTTNMKPTHLLLLCAIAIGSLSCNKNEKEPLSLLYVEESPNRPVLPLLRGRHHLDQGRRRKLSGRKQQPHDRDRRDALEQYDPSDSTPIG